jgi:hypothetical protein
MIGLPQIRSAGLYIEIRHAQSHHERLSAEDLLDEDFKSGVLRLKRHQYLPLPTRGVCPKLPGRHSRTGIPPGTANGSMIVLAGSCRAGLSEARQFVALNVIHGAAKVWSLL